MLSIVRPKPAAGVVGARSGEKHDEAEAEEDGQDVELEIAGAAHDYKQMLAKVDFCFGFGFVFGF